MKSIFVICVNISIHSLQFVTYYQHIDIEMPANTLKSKLPNLVTITIFNNVNEFWAFQKRNVSNFAPSVLLNYLNNVNLQFFLFHCHSQQLMTFLLMRKFRNLTISCSTSFLATLLLVYLTIQVFHSEVDPFTIFLQKMAYTCQYRVLTSTLNQN